MVQQSSTMEPTIRSGESIVVDTSAYRTSLPKRWEAIVFEAPKGTGHWCSRIIALSGETVELTAGGLMVNGATVSPPTTASFALPAYRPPSQSSGSAVAFPFVVPSSSVFVLGDNPSQSLDSRYWGALDITKIIGRIEGK